MDTGVRGKHVRLDLSSQPPESASDVPDKSSCSDYESSSNSKGVPCANNESEHKPDSNPRFDKNLMDRYTDEQLTDFLLTEIDLLYKDAIDKLVAMGHNEKSVIKAILINGHCHGDMDLMSNIIDNTLPNLSTGASGCDKGSANTPTIFANLLQMREATLISLICLFKEFNPCSSHRDAMRWFLMNDLRVIYHSSMKISDAADTVPTTQRDNEQSNLPDLTPMISFLKDNLGSIATECRRLKRAEDQPDGDSSTTAKKDTTASPADMSGKNKRRTKLIVEKYHDMCLEDEEDALLLSVINEINDLDVKVKERKKRGDEKAARTLCNERNELQKLRMEREKENERIQQQKSTPAIDRLTLKNIRDVESALRQANREMKADTEAFKLGTYESVTKSSEVAKKEKSHRKKIVAMEKQKLKLEEEISSEKQKLINMEEEMIQLEAAKRTAEAKWREVQETKEHAIVRVKQERRLKEETKANNKRIQDSLRAKVNLDFKCHKDDIQRLKQEVSRVKSLTDLDHDLTSLSESHFDDEAIGKLLHGCGDESEEDDEDDVVEHQCIACAQNEVAVVYLPCAHEVVCVDCDEELKMDECLTCGAAIEHKIRVFGGSC